MSNLKLYNQQDIEEYKTTRNTTSSGKNILIYLEGFPDGINDINFGNPVELVFDSVKKNIKIKNVIFSGDFLIGDLESSENKIGLKFEGCEFKKDFTYDDRNKASIFNIITFNNCTFRGLTLFNGIKLDELKFDLSSNIYDSGCTFENNILFKDIESNISFLGANFNGIINFKDLLPDTNISINNGIISGNIRINSHFSSIEINELIVKKTDIIIPKIDIYSKNNNYNTSTIKISKIKNLDELVISGDVNSKIKSIQINKYYMSGGNHGLFLIYNMYVGEFEYKSSTITPKISINNMIFDSLIFDDINLGGAIFNNSKINKLKLVGVVLDESKFNGCDFPDFIEEIDDKDIMKDNYRQLKFVMDENGNHTEANKFYSKEMECYGKTLTWKENFFDKLLFIFQNEVSEYGNNWFRALRYLAYLSFIASGVVYFYSVITDRFYVDNIFYIFVTYLNPLFLLPSKLGNIVINYKSIEILMFIFYKAIYSVILYQLIISAKRTTKR